MTTTPISIDDLNADASIGAEAAEQQAKEGRKSYHRLDNLKWTDGQTHMVRFLNDVVSNNGAPYPAVLTISTHWVKTKAKPPAGYRGKFPPKMPAVCQNDRLFNGKLAPCYICDNYVEEDGKYEGEKVMPRKQTWGLAAMREEVKDPQTGQAGIATVKKEITVGKEGDQRTLLVPEIRLIQQSWNNFFSPLRNTVRRKGTVLDRDIWVTRTGKGMNDTKYGFEPDDEPWEIEWPIGSGQYQKMDLRNPDIMAEYYPVEIEGVTIAPNLLQLAIDQASVEYYEKFFIPLDTDGEDSDEQAAPPAPSNDADQEELDALASKVMSRYTGDEANEAEQESTPPSGSALRHRASRFQTR